MSGGKRMNPTFKHFWVWIRKNHPHILAYYLQEMMEEEE